MADKAEIAMLGLVLTVAFIYLTPGFLAGLLWALLPAYGESLPPGTGLILCLGGMAIIAVRCIATRDPRWLSKSTGLTLALAAGMLVSVRKIYDNGSAPATGSLAMPLAIAIALFLLFIGLSAVGRIGVVRGVAFGVSVIAGGEVLRVARGGPIHPELAAFGMNPITIGQFSALGVLLAIFLIRQHVARPLHVVILLICVGGLVATDSRGPMVGLGVALLTMYIQQVLKKGKKRDFRIRPLIPLSAIIIGVLAVNATASQYAVWFRTSDADGNASARLSAMTAAVRSIVDSPFVGQGADRYNMGELGITSGLPTFPHNVFLEIWSEYGLIPFALLAMAVVIVVRRSGSAGRPIALGFVVCFSISGSLDTSLGLWVALALALILTPVSEQVSRQRLSRQRLSEQLSSEQLSSHESSEPEDDHSADVRSQVDARTR